MVYNAQNTNNKDDKLHMGPFVTAVVPTSILLIEDVITDYVETIHLFEAGLELEIISITPGLGALNVPLLPLFLKI